jgi:hypothetical protein
MGTKQRWSFLFAVILPSLLSLAGCHGNAQSGNVVAPMPSSACGGEPPVWAFHPAARGTSPAGTPGLGKRWVALSDWRVTVNASEKPKQYLSYGGDFEPSWSKSGSMIAYFHPLYFGSTFDGWRNAICVIHADGSQPTALSTGAYTDFSPTWTRDGTNRVIFNRYGMRGITSNDVYMISSDGAPGSEVLISTPANGYEHSFSGLKDGRLFIDRIDWSGGRPTAKSFLLTPRPGGSPNYQEITRPISEHQLWQAVSVSPSETKIAYMLDGNADMVSRNDDVLYYADFDVNTRMVSHPVAITTYDLSQVSENPSWSADESMIIYDSNRSGVYQLYAYHLADHTTTLLSDDPSVNFQSAVLENLPK